MKLKAPVGDIISELEKEITRLPTTSNPSQPQLSTETQNIIKEAFRQAKKTDEAYISREHLFLALLLTDCQVSPILNKFGLVFQKINDVIQNMKGSQSADNPNPENQYNVLEKYTHNLTHGALNPVN